MDLGANGRRMLTGVRGTAEPLLLSIPIPSEKEAGEPWSVTRQRASRRFDVNRILDTEPEQAFYYLTFLASQICGTPMALITLLDEQRQWFKSRVGTSATETERSIAFCEHTIQQDDVFVIPDTLADERFRENPLVLGEPWGPLLRRSAPGHA